MHSDLVKFDVPSLRENLVNSYKQVHIVDERTMVVVQSNANSDGKKLHLLDVYDCDFGNYDENSLKISQNLACKSLYKTQFMATGLRIDKIVKFRSRMVVVSRKLAQYGLTIHSFDAKTGQFKDSQNMAADFSLDYFISKYRVSTENAGFFLKIDFIKKEFNQDKTDIEECKIWLDKDDLTLKFKILPNKMLSPLENLVLQDWTLINVRSESKKQPDQYLYYLGDFRAKNQRQVLRSEYKNGTKIRTTVFSNMKDFGAGYVEKTAFKSSKIYGCFIGSYFVKIDKLNLKIVLQDLRHGREGTFYEYPLSELGPKKIVQTICIKKVQAF
jgi:hypothetical protein